MFEIQYKIVPADYDDYAGENGFLQICVNEFRYGNIRPDEFGNLMNEYETLRELQNKAFVKAEKNKRS